MFSHYIVLSLRFSNTGALLIAQKNGSIFLTNRVVRTVNKIAVLRDELKNLLNKHYRALSVCIDFISKQEVTLHIILIFNAFVLTKNMKFVTFCAYKLFEKFFQKNDANWGNYFVEHSVCSSFLDPYTEPRIPKFRYSQVIFGGPPSLTKSENR